MSALLVVTAGHGQTLPSAGSILRQQESATPSRAPQAIPAPTVEMERRISLPDMGGAAVRVTRIRLTGGQGLVQETQLLDLVRTSMGQSLTSTQLLALAEQVTSYLKAQGWILAQAYLPPQDVTDGDIEIRIRPGALDGGIEGIVVAGQPLRVSAQRVRRTVAAAMAGAAEGALNASELEEGLLRVGELAGVSATASLERGAQPGTSRLTVEAIQAPLIAGGLTADNFGSPYIGVNRLTGLFMFNSLLGQGDSAMLNLVRSSGIELLTTNLGVPVGYSGLKLGGSVTALRYRVGGALADLGLSGKAQMTGLNVSYPLLLGRSNSVRATLGLDRKAFVDTLASEVIGDKRATVLSVGLSGQMNDAWLGGMNDWSLRGERGRMNLSRLASVLEVDQSGPQGHGLYDKWSYAFARLQPLARAWSAQFSVNGQVAAKNLDSSEKFSLGGNSGVRAYPGGEGVGDSGWVASLTVRHDITWPTSDQRIELSGFIDTGRIQVNKSSWAEIDSATGLNRYALSGAGLGVSLAHTQHYRTRLIWARSLGSNPGRSVSGNNSDGKAGRSRVLLSLNVDF